MKTSVEIDEKKVDLAKQLGKATTLKQLIDEALDAYIQQARRHSMGEMLGTRFMDESYTQAKKNVRSRR